MVNGIPLRLYSESECSSLGGGWAANGECRKPDGTGSFSWDCRNAQNSVLNSITPSIGGGTSIGGVPNWVVYVGVGLLAWNMLKK